ncbi:MAG: hypothetical protein KatS3mg110_2491 [Pirellulaceae bacterium]|nr:MAG: hypothetical protein KatS3mg110_2491 [Pirellulaceae bacterium]
MRIPLWWIWIVLYVVFLSVLVSGMFYARRQALALYTTAQARQEWQEWVAEARRQEAGKGPVRRRAPQVGEPPAAVLMRDYFGTCLAGAVVLSSALYWSLAFMIHGALFVRPARPSDPAKHDS